MIRKIVLLFLCSAVSLFAWTQSAEQRVVLERGPSTIVLEPYAPNIIRVTLSLKKDAALAPPGYGMIASPSAAGWTHEKKDVDEVYRSSSLVVTVKGWRRGKYAIPQSVMDPGKYFSGSTPGADIVFSA